MAIDLPGHGNSSKIESESYSIENQAKRLDQFVSKLGLNKFHIAGNSMGGAIAGKYTKSYPDKVLSLTLFDNGGVPSAKQSEFYKPLTEEGKNIFLINSEEDFDISHGFRFVIPPPIPEPMKGYMVKQSIENRDFYEKIFQDLMAEQYSLENDLPKINTRTLIIWGDKDRIIDVSSVEILENGLSNYESVIMKDCGHVPMMERPEEAADHYLKFLEKR